MPYRSSSAEFWRAPLSAATVPSATIPPAEGDFSLLADALPTLCWMARNDGYIYWYNKRWHDYCGSTPEDMEGWGWTKVHDPLLLPKVTAEWQASVASGQPFEMTFPLRGADGQFRPFLTRIIPLRDETGAVQRWFGVNTMISEQVRIENALHESESKFDALADAMPQMVWSTSPDGVNDYNNARWYEFTGQSRDKLGALQWSGLLHTDDLAATREAWSRSLSTGEPFEVEYRLRHHSGVYRWVLVRALPIRSSGGRIIRWIGTCTDVDEARRSAERVKLFNAELSHRIKNIFAIINGLIRLSLRRAPEQGAFGRDLLKRIAALGVAHDFARPHDGHETSAAVPVTLHAMLAQLFAPYAAADGRIRCHITGDDLAIDDRGATPIALLIHELATNAAKYGALSVEEGSVDIATSLKDGLVTLIWQERGGPPLTAPPGESGFGTQLASISVEQQLGGSIAREWRADGLKVTVSVGANRLLRSMGKQPEA